MSERSHDTDRLSEYLDGGLGAAERSAVERHLSECAGCRGLVEELRAVIGEAAALPPVPPARDLWPEIRGRLAPRGTGSLTGSGIRGAVVAGVVRPWSRRGLVVTVPQLLAASLAVAVLSASAVWAVLGGAVGPAATGTAGAPVATAPAGPPGVVLAAYEPAMSDLEEEYQRRRDELDPETIRVVERNLAIIDAAIGEASAALAADPSSGFLHTHLAAAMRLRMSLLRQATSI